MLEIIFIFIIVILAFAGVIWFAIRSTQKTKQQSVNKQKSRMEPDLSESDAFSAVLNQQMTQHTITAESDDGVNVSLSSQANATVDTTTAKATEQTEIDFKLNDDIDFNIDLHTETEPTMAIVNDWDMVIAFTILAKEGKTFSGEDLKWTLENEQFQYGEMQIFHRLTLQGKPLFSVANILDPGTFDLSNITAITTPGILIFAKLPGPINGLTLFDDLLETARTLTNKLSGFLCDDARQPISDKSIEEMRNRILNLNFSLHSENQEPHVYTD